jgi:small conductance mechanosensitive channel
MALEAYLDRLIAGLWRYLLEPVGLQPGDLAWAVDRIPSFLGVLLGFYLVTRALIWGLRHTFLSPDRVDPMLASLVNRLLQAVLLFVGFSVALLVFGINVLDLALALGLVGAALALGLQNSVANIMGGISLVVDRPFEVGDRIQIGDFWGDVEEIGLRSTRVLTARREYVIVPNALMDEREIWNYTKRYPELRIDIPVQISYDSDADRARRLIKQVARDDEHVLSFPRPEVLVREFQDSGLQLELQCFIEDSRGQYEVRSDLRRGIKKTLDRNGVEIPYPYRTLVDKDDLPDPVHDEQPAADDPKPQPSTLADRRLLVATAGAGPAMRKADTVVRLADRLDADIVLTYISPRASIADRREGEKAADIFHSCARRHGVDLELEIEAGDVVETMRDVARRRSCGAVVIDGSRLPMPMAWRRADVGDRLREALDIPVVVVPPSLEIDEDQVEAAREALDARSEGDPPP